MFAATPPLEALRLLTSWAGTVGDGVEDMGILVSDVRRASFYAEATRDVYVHLPAEDEQAKPGERGKLNLSFYGTRGAGLRWANCYSQRLVEGGSSVGWRINVVSNMRSAIVPLPSTATISRVCAHHIPCRGTTRKCRNPLRSSSAARWEIASLWHSSYSKS